MSDRLEAAEALLATVEAGQGRINALAQAHLPFRRVVKLTMAARVGGSPARLTAEAQADSLDRALGSWRRAYSQALVGGGRAAPPLSRPPSSAPTRQDVVEVPLVVEADDGQPVIAVAVAEEPSEPGLARPSAEADEALAEDPDTEEDPSAPQGPEDSSDSDLIEFASPDEVDAAATSETDLAAGAAAGVAAGVAAAVLASSGEAEAPEEAGATEQDDAGVSFPQVDEPTMIGEIPPEVAAAVAEAASEPEQDEGLDEATAVADSAELDALASEPSLPPVHDAISQTPPFDDESVIEDDSLFDLDLADAEAEARQAAVVDAEEDEPLDEGEGEATDAVSEPPFLPETDEPTDQGPLEEVSLGDLAPFEEELSAPELASQDLRPLEEVSIPLGSDLAAPAEDDEDPDDPANEKTTISDVGGVAAALAAMGLAKPGVAGAARVAGPDEDDEAEDEDALAPTAQVGLSQPRSVSPGVMPEIKEGPAAPTLGAPRPAAAAIQLMGDGQARTLTDTLELGSAEETGAIEEVSDEVEAPAGNGGFGLHFEAAEEEEEDEVHIPELSDDPSEIRIESVLDENAEASPAPDAGATDGFVLAAQAAEGRGDLQAAVVSYGDVLGLDPDRVDAYLARGRCLLELGDYAAAMSDFQHAEDLAPDSPDPLVEMGNLFFARKEYRRGIHYYDQAIELDPTHAMARCRRGICHHYRKDHEQALADLQRAYALDPEIPNIGKYVQMAVKAMRRAGR